jgi:hypothetical protein
MAAKRSQPWRCLRCKAGAEWITRNRKKCLRCGAGREWLSNDTAGESPTWLQSLRDEPRPDAVAGGEA